MACVIQYTHKSWTYANIIHGHTLSTTLLHHKSWAYTRKTSTYTLSTTTGMIDSATRDRRRTDRREHTPRKIKRFSRMLFGADFLQNEPISPKVRGANTTKMVSLGMSLTLTLPVVEKSAWNFVRGECLIFRAVISTEIRCFFACDKVQRYVVDVLRDTHTL